MILFLIGVAVGFIVGVIVAAWLFLSIPRAAVAVLHRSPEER